MSKPSRWFSLLVLAVGSIVAFAPSRSSGDAARGEADFEALSWLEGHWVAERGDAFLEEVWTAPRGDSLMCVFKWQDKGKTSLYELVVIEQQEDAVRMLLRHFHPGLRIWKSEVDGPMTFELESQRESEAVFVKKSTEGEKRISYRREGDVLKARVWDDAGKEDLRFEYRRAD